MRTQTKYQKHSRTRFNVLLKLLHTTAINYTALDHLKFFEPKRRYKPVHKTPGMPPRIQHNLELALFKKGPTFLKDPSSGKFNFDPYLLKIPKLSNFNMDSIPAFIRTGQDLNLHRITREAGAKYCSSTSSINDLLSQMKFLMNRGSLFNNDSFSSDIKRDLASRMSVFLRSGASSTLVYKEKDDVYCVQATSKESSSNILMELGKQLETFLTVTPEEFQSHLKNAPFREASLDMYHFSQIGSLVLRAQLDSHHPNLPNKTFDVKTRACLAIRGDIVNYADNAWYKIKHKKGKLESFEREYFDMLRSAFVKYSLQARIGNMDGIFVAYHNVEEMFGFEYIPLSVMEKEIYGSTEMAEQQFDVSIQLLTNILETITLEYPKQTVQLLFSKPTCLIFITPHHSKFPTTTLEVTTKSTINGVETPSPTLEDPKNDEWRVYYEVKKLKYDPSIYESGHGRTNQGFIHKLKDELRNRENL